MSESSAWSMLIASAGTMIVATGRFESAAAPRMMFSSRFRSAAARAPWSPWPAAPEARMLLRPAGRSLSGCQQRSLQPMTVCTRTSNSHTTGRTLTVNQCMAGESLRHSHSLFRRANTFGISSPKEIVTDRQGYNDKRNGEHFGRAGAEKESAPQGVAPESLCAPRLP